MSATTRVHTLAVLVALFASAAVPESHAQMYQEADVSVVDIHGISGPPRADGVVWEHRIWDRPAGYLRLEFEDIQAVEGLYAIVIRDGRDRILVKYSYADLQGVARLMTPVLYTNTAVVQISGELAAGTPLLKIKKVIGQHDNAGRLTPQSAVPVWRAYPEEVEKRSPAYRAGESVAKLFLGNGYVCTGFLVGPTTLLTNYHCILLSSRFNSATAEGRVQCDDVQAHFDFNIQSNPQGSRRAQCSRVIDYDEALDFALLGFEAIPLLADKTPRSPLPIADRAPASSEPVFVIHHPAGLSKKVSACNEYLMGDVELEHDCSTLGGSSGSPLLSASGTVIGLHYAGPYKPEMTIGEIDKAIRDGAVFRNKAKNMVRIRDRISEKIN